MFLICKKNYRSLVLVGDGISMSTALPHFNSLVDGTSDDEGTRPVEVDRGAKMCMRLQALAAPLVCDIPHANGLVVRCREQIFAARMPGNPADPVVMPHESDQAHAS